VISWDEDNATSYELLWKLLDGKSDYRRMRNIRNRTEVSIRVTNNQERIAQRYLAELTSVQNGIEGGSSPELVFNTDLISKTVVRYNELRV